MELGFFQVDAFALAPLGGNPAGVVPLESWLPGELMLAVAAENNLAETAFFVPDAGGPADFHLRWFTPTVEVDLCGHATLATAFVLFELLGWRGDRIRFRGRSGPLAARRDGDLLELDFPAQPGAPCEGRAAVTAAIGVTPRELFLAEDLMAVLEDEAAVRAVRPDFGAVAALPARGLIITAAGDDPEVDFVSRFFAPAVGVPEDPATGSAHCTLTPYWAARLGRDELRAVQLSARLGAMRCRYDRPAGRVAIAGRAFPYLTGRITIPDPSSYR
ncbi:MAG: PhzF family phenazine biosynthesis protein [Planctomycetes bacterium]|nr:PhzF family phenazine biosynthesis protein [Planctomycetota bacterium]